MKFIRSVREEMKLVTWPTRKKLVRDSMIVIETSIIFAAMFFVMDTAIQALIKLVIR